VEKCKNGGLDMHMLDGWFERIYMMNRHEIQGNFCYIGEGISRVTYGINERFVAKFDKNLDGLDQSKLEYKIYNHSGSRLKKHLCTIIWYRPGMLVMPRAIPLTSITPMKKIDIHSMGLDGGAMEDLRHSVKKYDLLYDDIIDTSSWGLLNGRPVLIDYGCTN
jgi:hypothetical protein